MRRISLRIMVSLLGLALAVLMTTPLALAQTAQPGNTTGCQTLVVTLHGNNPATSTCLQSASSKKGASPLTGTVGCGSRGALAIFADANYRGWVICFQGSGFVNMNSYKANIFWNWNDQASSYQAGCSGGTFYIDTGGSGQPQTFTAGSESNFDGQNGHLPNDSLSSMIINTNC